MEIKKGLAFLLAPKILCEKVLTNVSGCATIVATKDERGKKNENET